MCIRKAIHKIFAIPFVFTNVRALLENNFKSQKNTVKKELAGKKPGKILDLGCGTGTFSVYFDKKDYYGIDFSKKFIDYAKKKHKDKRFYVMDAQKLKFKKRFFDSILIIGFFHHLTDNESAKVLKEMKRVLKRKGKALVIEDIPTESKCNVIGRLIYKFDVGLNVKTFEDYKKLFGKYFKIEKSYKIPSGFCDYGVHVLKY